MSLTKEYLDHCKKSIKRIQDEGLSYRTILPMPSTPIKPPDNDAFNLDILVIDLDHYSPDVEAVFCADGKYLPQVITSTGNHILGLFTNLKQAKLMIKEYKQS